MYDMKNLQKLKTLEAKKPEAWKAFMQFNDAALADGAIPRLYKELMAVAVALTTQCPYCIELHREAAAQAGATPQQLVEVGFVAAALRAGGAITHATHLIKE